MLRLRRAGLRNNSKVILDDSAYRHYNRRAEEEGAAGRAQASQLEEYQRRQASGTAERADAGGGGGAAGAGALDAIQRELDDVERMVADFERRRPGHKSDAILQELLTQQVLKLDGVDTGGVQAVRDARKRQVTRVHALSKRVEDAGQMPVVEAPRGGVGV